MHVQVRVMHAGSVYLPMRVGVFAISQEDREKITEWLPPEFVPVMDATDSDELAGSPQKRKRNIRSKANKPTLEESLRRSGLKTHTVLSHVFRTSNTSQVLPPQVLLYTANLSTAKMA
jgi:hypothetical protein